MSESKSSTPNILTSFKVAKMGFRNCEARFCAITDEHSVAYLLLIFLIVLQF